MGQMQLPHVRGDFLTLILRSHLIIKVVHVHGISVSQIIQRKILGKNHSLLKHSTSSNFSRCRDNGNISVICHVKLTMKQNYYMKATDEVHYNYVTCNKV